MTERLARYVSIRTLLIASLVLSAGILLLKPDMVLQLNLLIILASLGIAAFMFPGTALVLGVVSLVTSPEHSLEISRAVQAVSSSLDVKSLHKALIIVTMIPAFVRFGMRPGLNGGFVALVFIFMTSLLFSTRYPSLTPLQMVKSLVGLLLPFTYFSLKMPRRLIDPALRAISFLPIISIALGAGYDLLDVQATDGARWQLFGREFTGAYRLAGSNIPAALAFICYAAIFVSFYKAVFKKDQSYYFTLIVAVIALVLTGTRTPLLASILVMAMGAVLASPRDLRGSSKFILLLGGMVLVGSALAIYWPNLQERFATTSAAMETGMINTSGRSAIWEVMLNAYEVNQVFGRGIGTGAIIFQDVSDKNIEIAGAAHNEYLRFLLDAGIVGLIAYLAGMAQIVIAACRGINASTARYVAALFFTFALYSFTDNTVSGALTLILFLAVRLVTADAQQEQSKIVV